MSITLAQVGELCAMLSRTYPNATFDEQSPEIWHGWLKSYDQATVIRAVAVACKNSPDFCPTPVRIAADIDAAASPLPSPDLIWAKIMKLANTIPPDHRTRAIREIAAIDPLAAHVIDEGIGWFAIANTPVEKSDHLFRKFREGLLDARAKSRYDTQYQSVNGPSGNLPNGIDSGIEKQIARVLGVGDDNYPEVDE